MYTYHYDSDAVCEVRDTLIRLIYWYWFFSNRENHPYDVAEVISFKVIVTVFSTSLSLGSVSELIAK